MSEERRGQPGTDEVRAWMLSRMREPFTFGELHRGADRQFGYDERHYRLADRLIQAERRAGRIELLPGAKWRPASKVAPPADSLTREEPLLSRLGKEEG